MVPEGINRLRERLREVQFHERFMWRKANHWNPRQGYSRIYFSRRSRDLWSEEFDLRYKIQKAEGHIDYGT